MKPRGGAGGAGGAGAGGPPPAGILKHPPPPPPRTHTHAHAALVLAPLGPPIGTAVPLGGVGPCACRAASPSRCPQHGGCGLHHSLPGTPTGLVPATPTPGTPVCMSPVPGTPVLYPAIIYSRHQMPATRQATTQPPAPPPRQLTHRDTFVVSGGGPGAGRRPVGGQPGGRQSRARVAPPLVASDKKSAFTILADGSLLETPLRTSSPFRGRGFRPESRYSPSQPTSPVSGRSTSRSVSPRRPLTGSVSPSRRSHSPLIPLVPRAVGAKGSKGSVSQLTAAFEQRALPVRREAPARGRYGAPASRAARSTPTSRDPSPNRRAAYSRNASPSRGAYSRNTSPSRSSYSRNTSPSRGSYSRNASPTRGSYSRNASPSRTAYSRNASPSRRIAAYSRDASPSRRTAYSRNASPSRIPYARDVSPTRRASVYSRTVSPHRIPYSETASPSRRIPYPRNASPSRIPAYSRDASPGRRQSLYRDVSPMRRAPYARDVSPPVRPLRDVSPTRRRSPSKRPSKDLSPARRPVRSREPSPTRRPMRSHESSPARRVVGPSAYYSPSRRPVAVTRDMSPARRVVMSPTRIPVRAREPSPLRSPLRRPEPSRFIEIMPKARSPSPSRGVQTDPEITKSASVPHLEGQDAADDGVLRSPSRSTPSLIPVPISRVSSPVRKDPLDPTFDAMMPDAVLVHKSSPKRAPQTKTPSRTPTRSPRRVAKAHEATTPKKKEDARTPAKTRRSAIMSAELVDVPAKEYLSPSWTEPGVKERNRRNNSSVTAPKRQTPSRAAGPPSPRAAKTTPKTPRKENVPSSNNSSTKTPAKKPATSTSGGTNNKTAPMARSTSIKSIASMKTAAPGMRPRSTKNDHNSPAPTSVPMSTLAETPSVRPAPAPAPSRPSDESTPYAPGPPPDIPPDTPLTLKSSTRAATPPRAPSPPPAAAPADDGAATGSILASLVGGMDASEPSNTLVTSTTAGPLEMAQPDVVDLVASTKSSQDSIKVPEGVSQGDAQGTAGTSPAQASDSPSSSDASVSTVRRSTAHAPASTATTTASKPTPTAAASSSSSMAAKPTASSTASPAAATSSDKDGADPLSANKPTSSAMPTAKGAKNETPSGGKRGAAGGCLRFLRRGSKGPKSWAKPRPPKPPRSVRAPGTPGLLRRLACCGRRTAPRDSAEALAAGTPPAAAPAAATTVKQGGCAGCISKLRAFCCRTRSANDTAPSAATSHWLDSLTVRLPKGFPKGLPKGIPKGFPKGLPKGLPKSLPGLAKLHTALRRKDVAAKPGAATASSTPPQGNCCSRGWTRCGALTRAACGALFCLNTACCMRSACRQTGGCCARCCPLPQTPTPAAAGPAGAAGERRKSQARSLARGKSMTSGSKELSKLDAALVEHNGVMRGAIPVLPMPLAWICLMCNVFVPGLGTLSMGLFCLCVGKPRFSASDTAKARFGAFCLDTLVAASQLFTVLFCLVGWGWSIWWGLIALRLAKKFKRIRLAERAAATRPAAITVPAGGAGDVEKGLRGGKPP